MVDLDQLTRAFGHLVGPASVTGVIVLLAVLLIGALLPFTSLAQLLDHPVSLSVPVSQIGGNLLLLVPFGLLAPLSFPTLRTSVTRVLVAAAGLLVLVEALQVLLPVHRVASVDDVIVGLAGTLLGRALLAGARRLQPSRADSSRSQRAGSSVSPLSSPQSQ